MPWLSARLVMTGMSKPRPFQVTTVGLLRVEPLREVGEHLALALVLAHDAEALRHVVLEEQAAERDDLVERRGRHAVAVVQARVAPGRGSSRCRGRGAWA